MINELLDNLAQIHSADRMIDGKTGFLETDEEFKERLKEGLREARAGKITFL